MPRIAHLVTPRADIELVRAFQDGSVEAFDELFLRYHDAITGLNFRLVRNHLLAEDLTQETFVRVLRSLERVDQSFNFSAWIHRIATNLCYDALRRRKQGQAAYADGLRASTPSGDPDELLSLLPNRDMSGSPAHALDRRELEREVWEVAGRLPRNYRNVLILRDFEDLPYATIAHVMSLSEAAIETLIHRARRRFKAEYLYLSFVRSSEDECSDSLQDLLSGVGLQVLMQNQRISIQQHIDGCASCRTIAMRADTRPPSVRRRADNLKKVG